jgi:CRP-like cAMP-binding protein
MAADIDKEYTKKRGSVVSAPLLCQHCQIGPLTVYGPTVKQQPHFVTARRRSIRVFEPHDLVFKAGQVPDAIYVVYSGWAASYVSPGKGIRHILDFSLPADVVNPITVMCGPQPLPYAVTAMTSLVLCEFPIRAANELLSGSEMQREEVAKAYHKNVSQFFLRLGETARLSAEARVARLTVRLANRLKRIGLLNGNGFDFPIRREEFADAMGITLIHLNRTLAALHAKGALRFEHRRMEIIDEKLLHELAKD